MGIFSSLREALWPTALPTVMANGAQEFADLFRRENSPIDASKLDLGPASLRLIDEVLDDYRAQKAELPSDVHLLMSAYVFEVIRLQLGGEYQRAEDGTQIVLGVGAPTGRLDILAMARIATYADGTADEGVARLLQQARDLAAEGRAGELS